MSQTSDSQFDAGEGCSVSFDVEKLSDTRNETRSRHGLLGLLSIAAVATVGFITFAQHISPRDPRDATGTVGRKLSADVVNPATATEVLKPAIHETSQSVVETPTPLSDEMAQKYESLALFRNVTEPVRVTDVPFFFHIFKSAGSTMKTLMSDCYDLVRAHQTKDVPSLEVIRGTPGGDLVNVHTHSPESIIEAKALGLIESRLSDTIVSSFIYEGAQLFNDHQQGRMFSVFRHPVDRAVSLFFYLCHATWEDTHNAAFCDESLLDYATRVSESNGIENNNWLTRRLSGVLGGELREEHLTLAIEVVRSKFLVGLIDEMDETMRRLELFFNWKAKDDECINNRLHHKPVNQYKHERAAEGSEEFNLIARASQYDIRLYEAVKEIFKEQRALFPQQS